MAPFAWFIGFLGTSLAITVWLFKKYYMPKEEPAPDMPEPVKEEAPLSEPDAQAEPKAPTEPKEDKITLMALAIRDFEGWKPGSASWRRNNPGNIKGTNGKFLAFKTPEEGFTYLCNYLRRAATGKHAAYSPDMDMRDFFSIYAPDGDAIITNYTTFVCTKIGVDMSTKIKELVV